MIKVKFSTWHEDEDKRVLVPHKMRNGKNAYIFFAAPDDESEYYWGAFENGSMGGWSADGRWDVGEEHEFDLMPPVNEAMVYCVWYGGVMWCAGRADDYCNVANVRAYYPDADKITFHTVTDEGE